MNLQQLRYVVAVAELGSFTKAAADLFVVQSALSQQVRKLEDELGVRLFARTTRSVVPTPEGEALLPQIRQVLAGVDRLVIDAQALHGAVRGRLTVGLMEVPPELLDVAALMAAFHARYPEVSVTLRSGGSDLLVGAVRDRKLDVAIVGLAVESAMAHVEFTPLLSEPLVAVLPVDHPASPGASVSVHDLAACPFIDFPPGYGLRRETDRGFTSVTRHVAFEVTRVEQVAQFVRQGLGVALLPESVARSHADRDASLVLRQVSDAELRRQVNLVAPRAPVSAACQAFVRCVNEFVLSAVHSR
ncbi:LysR family transcriptional regulator [Nocardia sp. NPDC059239]|uniref:LysR family transcriptional regulator n=1 Tax=unclassified Nocardia TaxID=2637762 RepID=UPI003679A9DA